MSRRLDPALIRMALASYVTLPDTPLRPEERQELIRALAARNPDGTPVAFQPMGLLAWVETLRTWATTTPTPIGATFLAMLDREDAPPPTPAQVTAHRRWMASTVREEDPP